jgi:outer membrane receptor protein involved in Fe transport
LREPAAAGLALLACGAGAQALAQQAAPAAEQITVTAQPGTASPQGTTILGAGQIAASGVSSLGALLDQVPSFGSQGVNNAQNDGGFGEYFIDLRNLNFDRTLVLVDGKRFVLSGIQTDEAVDLNDIPLAFIDHVEILRDGTQPQYAADAVAGVVNVVLKDQIEGVRLDAYGGAAGAGDAGTADISLVGGHGFADGHVAFGLDVTQRDPVRQSDRSWAANPIASATATPSGPDILYGSTATPGGHAVGNGIDALALGGGQTRAFDATTDDFDFAPFRDLQGGLQRETAYFDADHALSDDITADVELLFTDRRATTLQPPQTLGLTGTDKHPDGFVIPASDPYNPFGEAVTLERVVSEAGAQTTTTSGPVWRVLTGLEGVQGVWDWSLSFDHGQSLSEYVTSNQINLTRALQTAGNGACPASAGCVQADWFGPDSLSQAALAYIAYTAHSRSAYQQTVGQARASAPVFTAPGGAARLTLGAEARAEAGATSVDGVTAQGDQAGNDAKPTSGGYQTYEAYGTLSVPLLRGLPAASRLDLLLAARETETSRYGAFATLRAVLDYAPVPGLHLRALSGTARRPPAISEAFGGITSAAQEVTDPCAANSGLRANKVVNENCLSQGLGPGFAQASSQIQVESGGNPALHPEQSENEELGITLAPPSLPFLSASVDWYHYRIRDAIDSLEDTDPNTIPDLCYESAGLGSPLCRLITRISGGGNAGQISSILGLDENVGTIKTDGFDFGLTLQFPPTALGAFKLDGQANWLMDYRLHTQGQTGFVQYAGTFPGLSGVGSYSRVRARLTADWTRGAWSAGWTGRFIAGARVLGAAPSDPYATAPGILYQDIEISRRFGRITAMAGVDNLADQRPPTLVDGETNTSSSTYDVLGRFVWGRVSVVF